MSSVDTPGGVGFTEELGGDAFASDGAVLPPPVEMQREEGLALREWRRKNAIRLKEKEMKEKESVKEIVEAADEYKIEFDRKWKATCMNNSTVNIEKEKSYLESREKFHAEANNNYFKTTAELIPKEVPKIEKRGKKIEEKNLSVVVIQGPKPGKPTDLSRMRQILVKLKHDVPTHMKLLPQPQNGNKTSLVPPTKPVAVIGS